MEGGRFAKLKSAVIRLWIHEFELTVRQKIKAEREKEKEEVLKTIHTSLKARITNVRDLNLILSDILLYFSGTDDIYNSIYNSD